MVVLYGDSRVVSKWRHVGFLDTIVLSLIAESSGCG